MTEDDENCRKSFESEPYEAFSAYTLKNFNNLTEHILLKLLSQVQCWFGSQSSRDKFKFDKKTDASKDMVYCVGFNFLQETASIETINSSFSKLSKYVNHLLIYLMFSKVVLK